ncbi:MAG: type II toxin-antitoxin system HicB family antitoxin [Gemmatimonadetes bacterium]|nr:type II toxin-antitoxin system HicB family antitoxin [Gemmatimonadota bacterium]MXY81809.1 type II toxin-antitoxin system HicB family antitoxin [Gemmatimonadota bacterium]MYA21658.1 type II toxin-antitoxin system HicB family antitoxin [Gemmatimonadota bacterium]MYB69369.1 type II toxin-antitoxin system HicB family antitoxin [Gemmatimonadota bacterium]
MTTYVLTAEIEQDEDGRWSAWIDALPGCAAWGHTREEALLALQDAADAYIEDMEETDEQVLKRVIEVVDSPLVVVTR